MPIWLLRLRRELRHRGIIIVNVDAALMGCERERICRI